jgi:putative ABC transport system substrate-binding protein
MGLPSEAGALADRSRRAALYLDKILKGANPAELPVEQRPKYQLVIKS